MGLENAPQRDRNKEFSGPQGPELQIVPPETSPEVSHVPSDVAEKIIGQIEEEERKEQERNDYIDKIKRGPTLH